MSSSTQDLQSQRYMDVSDVAVFLRTTKGAVYTMVWRGILMPFRLGRKLLFLRTDLERLVETSNKRRH